MFIERLKGMYSHLREHAQLKKNAQRCLVLMMEMAREK